MEPNRSGRFTLKVIQIQVTAPTDWSDVGAGDALEDIDAIQARAVQALTDEVARVSSHLEVEDITV